MRIILPLFAAIAAMTTAPAAAQQQPQPPQQVSLDSDVMVERTKTDADGRAAVVLEAPSVVVPGDHLVFVLRYHNSGARPASNFVVTNPLPAAVQYAGVDDQTADVSIDGGRTWGKLAALTKAGADGSRQPASAADVTHIRWAFAQAIPAGEAGRLTFRGVVR